MNAPPTYSQSKAIDYFFLFVVAISVAAIVSIAFYPEAIPAPAPTRL